MTTSISNAQAEALAQTEPPATLADKARQAAAARHADPGATSASRLIFIVLCTAIVLTTLAYGTVHYWALAIFELGAASIVVLWVVDAWQTGELRLSRNALQWPLIGLAVLGLVQLLPLGDGGSSATVGSGNAGALASVKSLSLDPYSTRLVLVQIVSLLVYFAASLAYTDSARRLRLLVQTITIFGFLLAIFGLIQSFTSPTKIYWLRELPQSTAFGPFINRHHFAGYMELTLALPLGLLFSGAVERDKRFIYIFAVAMMGIALIFTGSRGGIISLVLEALFLVIVTGVKRVRESSDETESGGRVRAAMMRAGLALALVGALFGGVVLLGGEAALSRFVGTVNAEDPTTGRAHFWNVTLDIIKHHPVIGTGLGAFGVVYTRYDTRNGAFRLEQAHNDYLQVLSDAGIIGAALGVFFIFVLFRSGLKRAQSGDVFRRGVAMGALAGCFAVLVHSFFDFTLHTTSNALLFLFVAALATLNGRVEHVSSRGRRRRRRSSRAEAGQGSEAAA